ncbi:MAG: hypothetical protein K9M57_02290 [Phycisphaerae bacterium]|nr:hypothetical protein [Phycisphaerae bacterium]
MNWRKIKIWTKVSLLVVLAIIIIIFIASNTEKVQIKFYKWSTPEWPMYIFVISVANLGGVLYITAKRIRRIIKDVQLLMRDEKARQKAKEEIKEGVKPQIDSGKN